jgi:hypothetical protein
VKIKIIDATVAGYTGSSKEFIIIYGKE